MADDLEDAQDDYAKAVLLSGIRLRSRMQRNAQQEKLIKAMTKQLTALKEEKKSVEDGSKTWGDFAKTILGALADTLYGLGAELAARAKWLPLSHFVGHLPQWLRQVPLPHLSPLLHLMPGQDRMQKAGLSRKCQEYLLPAISMSHW